MHWGRGTKAADTAGFYSACLADNAWKEMSLSCGVATGSFGQCRKTAVGPFTAPT